MPSEIRSKYKVAVTVQDTAAITANAFSTGAQTVLNNTSAGNGGGCTDLGLWVEVTSGPSSAAIAEVYMETSYDGGVTYSAPAFRGGVAVQTGTGLYYVGAITDVQEFSRFKVKALSYGFTAKLVVKPSLPELQ